MRQIQMHLPGSIFGWIGALEVTTRTKWVAALLLLLLLLKYDTGTGVEDESRDPAAGAMEPVSSDCQE